MHIGTRIMYSTYTQTPKNTLPSLIEMFFCDIARLKPNKILYLLQNVKNDFLTFICVLL